MDLDRRYDSGAHCGCHNFGGGGRSEIHLRYSGHYYPQRRHRLFSNKPMLGAVGFSVVLQLLIIYTPFFNTLFSTQPLTLAELGITLAVSSVTFWMVEAEKLIRRWRLGR